MVMLRALATVLCISLSAVQALNEKCVLNYDCKDANAVCTVDGTCQCNRLSFASGSRCFQYATEYQGYCELDEQCSKFLGANSVCKRAGCVCSKGYVWHKGKCQAYAKKGERCDKNTICYDKNDLQSLQCLLGTCTCSSNHYDRGPDCRRKPSYFWENACVLNADCDNKNQICIKGKCSPKSKEEENIDRKILHYTNILLSLKESNDVRINANEEPIQDKPTYCKIDADCEPISNSQCDRNTGKCKCIDNTYYHFWNCYPGFGPCSGNENCTDVANSMCFESTTCICKPGYFLRNGECIAELGMADPDIKSASDCKIKPAELTDHTCYCSNYWFTSENKRYCIKTTTQEFQSCMENSWCDAMGPYSYCENNKCNCTSFAELNEDKFYCNKIDEPSTKSFCLRDNDCDEYQVCRAGECHCLEGFISDTNGRCLSDYGVSCIHNQCHGKYLCMDGKCDCHNNYVGVDGDCWKVADSLNETCTYKEQCRNIEFSDCQLLSANGTERTCSCVDGYTDYEKTCAKSKKYGDLCMTTADCTKVINKSFQCRNSICQCPLNQKLINGYCKSGASLSQISYIGISLSILSILVLG